MQQHVDPDTGEVDRDRAQQHHGVPDHREPPDQEATQQHPDPGAAVEDRRHRDGGDDALTDEDRQERRDRDDTQPCEAAAAHRSIGQVQTNISTKPNSTG